MDRKLRFGQATYLRCAKHEESYPKGAQCPSCQAEAEGRPAPRTSSESTFASIIRTIFGSKKK